MSEQTPRWGISTFLLVAFGQIISVTGSAITGFALGVWVYQETHSTTLFSLILLFTVLPALLLAPLAGVLADHWDRRIIMIASDSGAALCTGLLLLLISLGNLQMWQIYLIMGVNSVMRGLQTPAYLASVSVLVPKDQLGRANGILQMESTASYLFSPLLAGWMLDSIGIIGVLVVDLVTFMFAINTLLWVRFPLPKFEALDQDRNCSFWQATFSGMRFISARPGFMGLVVLFALGNFANIMTDTVMPPMLLEFASPTKVGGVLSTGGLGMLVGAVIMSTWGGPSRRVPGMLAFKGLAGLAVMAIGISRSVEWIALATFFYFLPFPLVNGIDQAIWQSKVPLQMQGRVFATRRMIAQSMIPIAYLTAGPLSDMFFKPLLTHNERLSLVLGWFFGIGPGRGFGLLVFLMGLLIVVLSVSAAINPRIWNIEKEHNDVI